MIDDFKRQAVAISLKKMFEPTHWLDICTIKEGLELLQIVPPAGQIEALRMLHCVHWSKMEPDFRQQVFQRIMALFEMGTSFDLVQIDRALGTGNVVQSIASVGDSASKRKLAGLLPFHRRS